VKGDPRWGTRGQRAETLSTSGPFKVTQLQKYWLNLSRGHHQRKKINGKERKFLLQELKVGRRLTGRNSGGERNSGDFGRPISQSTATVQYTICRARRKKREKNSWGEGKVEGKVGDRDITSLKKKKEERYKYREKSASGKKKGKKKI